jgi:hypothetical protein
MSKTSKRWRKNRTPSPAATFTSTAPHEEPHMASFDLGAQGPLRAAPASSAAGAGPPLPSPSCYVVPHPASPHHRPSSSRWNGASELRHWRRPIRAHRGRRGPRLRALSMKPGHPPSLGAAASCPASPHHRPSSSRWDWVAAGRAYELRRQSRGRPRRQALRRGLGEKALWGRGMHRVPAMGGSGLVYIGYCNNVLGMSQLVAFMLQ